MRTFLTSKMFLVLMPYAKYSAFLDIKFKRSFEDDI